MEAGQIQQWILVLSGAATMISVAVGVWLSLKDFRLKLRAEARAQESAELEAELRLNSLFSDLMVTANGRSGYTTSDKAVEFLLDRVKDVDVLHVSDGTATIRLDQLTALNRGLEELAILTLPVGSAAQDASVAAIFSLAEHYPRLRSTALAALDALAEPVTSKLAPYYAEKLRDLLGEPRTDGPPDHSLSRGP